MFIAILTTNIMSVQDLFLLQGKMNILLGAHNWSVDLEDDEKILRVAFRANVLPGLCEIIKMSGFKASILNIYHCDYGVDYPLIPHENRAAK